jgi:hypothetical protein
VASDHGDRGYFSIENAVYFLKARFRFVDFYVFNKRRSAAIQCHSIKNGEGDRD